MAMTAMKARMKAAMAVDPPKAMQAKKAKKEEQWMKKKNAELQQAKRDNVRLSVEFASIQAVALERADNKDAELQRVKRDNERLAAALEGKEAELTAAVEIAVRETEKRQQAVHDRALEIKDDELATSIAEAVKDKEVEIGVLLASCGIVRDLDSGGYSSMCATFVALLS